MSLTLSIGVMAPALDCKPGPPSPTIEHKRPFYFEDSQVVLQASHIITAFYFFNLPFTISLYTGGWRDIQNPSLLPNSGVPIFQ